MWILDIAQYRYCLTRSLSVTNSLTSHSASAKVTLGSLLASSPVTSCSLTSASVLSRAYSRHLVGWHWNRTCLCTSSSPCCCVDVAVVAVAVTRHTPLSPLLSVELGLARLARAATCLGLFRTLHRALSLSGANQITCLQFAL